MMEPGEDVTLKEQNLLFGDSDSQHLEDSGGHDWAAQQDWEQMERGFMTTGFREGIDAGKEESVQSGFNDGFRHGSYRGFLKGKLLALSRIYKLERQRAFLSTEDIDQLKNKLRDLNVRMGLHYSALEQQEETSKALARDGVSGNDVVSIDTTKGQANTASDEGALEFKEVLASVAKSLRENLDAKSSSLQDTNMLENLERYCPHVEE